MCLASWQYFKSPNNFIKRESEWLLPGLSIIVKSELQLYFIDFNEVIFAAIIIMVEFSDLFDNEDDVFQKKAKVCLQLLNFCALPMPRQHTLTPLQDRSISYYDNLCSACLAKER